MISFLLITILYHLFFFFNDPATTEIYTLSLHDALPIRRHHAVAYGAVVHKVVEYYLRRRAVGNYTPLDDLLAVYERAWAGEDILHRPGGGEPAEGFLTREHEEARKAAGREALKRFWHQEEADGVKPTWVEQEFGFTLGANRVRGRYDRVDEDLLGAVI